MKTIKATVHTELITSDDGQHTYEVIKQLEGVDGECGYLISLYPTRDETNIFASDSTLNHLVSHMQELGFNELHIINLISTVVNSGKLSTRGLQIDRENMEYIDKLMSTKEFQNSKFIIAWGNSLLSSNAINESKLKIFEMFNTHCPKGKLYQLTTIGLTLDSDIAPHPLYVGIRGGDFQWGLKEFKPTKKMLEAMKKTK